MGRGRFRWATSIVVVILVGIQLIPVNRTNPPVRSEVQAPDSVMSLLKRACYDCHSNRTTWPWYSYVAPASWFVVRHVNNGRSDLNFSEWPTFDFEEAEWAMNDIREQVEKGKMPLKSYLLLHPGARLTEAERRMILDWTER